MDDHTEDLTSSSGEDKPRLKRRLGARVFQPEELRFVDYFVDRPGSQGGPQHRRPQDVQRELRQLRTRDRTPPRPSGHQPLPRPPSKFIETFDGETLKALEKSLNRGRRKGGLGKYAKVLSKAGALYAAGRGEQLGAAHELVSVIEGYLKKKRMDAYAEEKAKGDAGDKITIRKVEEAQRMLLEAKRLIEDHVDRGFPGRDSDDPRARQRACEGHAIAMGQNFGMRKAGGGTSDVQLFGNSGGKVSYAFKSVNGESVQTGMPKGSGAMREAMSGAMSAFFKKGGLDFGFPEVHIAKMPIGEGVEVGALIEGISGDMADPEEIDKIYQADAENKAKWFNEETEKNRALSRQVPPADLHKVLLSNLAMANFDIKWGNIIAVDGSDGQKHARPFDGGTAFPGDDALKRLEEGFDVIPGQALLYEAVSPTRNMQELPAADMLLDAALVKQFLAIDTAAMWKVMQAERERYCSEFGFDAKLLDDASLMISVKSIDTIQRILKATPGITMRDFVTAYGQVFKTDVLK